VWAIPAAAAVVASVLALSDPGAAATAHVREGVLGYVAAPGEANDVVLAGAGERTIAVMDDGVNVEPGRGCSPLGAGVVCVGVRDVVLDLGDRNDRARLPAVGLPWLVGISIGAGLGDDHIEGGPAAELLDGGEGEDVLIGGAGTDWLRGSAGNDVLDGGRGDDGVNYLGGPPRGVRVDLALGRARGAGVDRLIGVESAIGTAYADVLRGNARRNWLLGSAGSDVVEGKGGRDVLDGALGVDRLRARDGVRDVVRGGGGRDRGTVDRGVDVVRGIDNVD